MPKRNKPMGARNDNYMKTIGTKNPDGALEQIAAARDRAPRNVADEPQRLLAAIVESSDDAIASKDLNGIVTSWNRAAERLFGYKAEEIVGESVLRIIPPELHQDEPMILGKLRRGEKIDHFETVRVSKDGRRIEVSLTISPVRDERGNVIGAAKIIRDITESKKIERALRVTEKLAAAGRLAATVAHEINNPLEAITNLVYLAKRDLANTAKVAEYLEMASRELDRVAHIARQTLGFYRDASSPVRLSVAQVMDELLCLYEKRFESRNIRVIKQYDSDSEITALGGELRQAFSNIISNAIDAMPAGGPLVIRVSKSLQWKAPLLAGVRITILDTGSGIAPEHRKNMFQPFFTTKEDVGTGLGLWITRNIVEKHGGLIHVKSRTGEKEHGTAFSLFLPFEPVVRSPGKSPLDTPIDAIPTAGARR
jgi:PAS domain S-box-containing protein